MRQFLVRSEQMSKLRPGYTAGILVLFGLFAILEFGFWILDSGDSGNVYAVSQSKIQNPNSKILGTVTPVCGVGWNIVPSLNTGNGWNTLTSVDSASAEDIWAVGYY